MIFTITANDTLTMWGRVFTDLADADTISIEFSNDLATGKTGKGGNTLIAKNEMGNNADVTLRVMRGSSDDKFLQAKMSAFDKDFAAFELANGSFTKRLGDGQANVTRDVYTMKGGTFKRAVSTRENVEGNTDQGVAVYNMLFANVKRELQ